MFARLAKVCVRVRVRGFLWRGCRLRRIASAADRRVTFLGSQEAAERSAYARAKPG